MYAIAWFGAGLAALACAGAAIAWWRHRAHLAELQRRLSWSEESRFMLERHAETVDAQLQEMSLALQAQEALLESRGQMERSAAMDLLMSPPSPAQAAADWIDTQPLGPPGDRYAETMPAVLTAEPAAAR
jgi:hypothetical protein